MTHDDQRKILDMLADGRLTPAEAESQLEALRRSAEQPIIDIGSGTDEPQPQAPPGRYQRFKERWWKREYVSTYVMLAPMLLMIISSIILLAVAVAGGLAVVVLFVPALVILLAWNNLLVPAAGMAPIGMIEAFAIAFLIALLYQGVTRWRR
jgi:hypothetical protein